GRPAGLGRCCGRRLGRGPGDELAAVLALVHERLSRATALARERERDGDGARARVLKAAGSLADDVAAAATVGDDDVMWVEGPAHAPTLKVAPVDVGALLAARLWGSVRTAVLTSATIPSALPQRLGLPAGSYDGLDVGSPFDYPGRAVLYCAKDLPDPRHPDYEK